MNTAIQIPPPHRTISPSKTPSKSRSFSDSASKTTPTPLQPSPTFRERVQHSKDDNAVPTTPKASRHARGLSLQMPPSLHMPSPSQFPRKDVGPLSPQLDAHNTYMQQQSQSLTGSPATSIPRHSRGLDWARACTNLHHSTVAESSADSSPIITQKPMMIPGRKMSVGSMMLDSPNLGAAPWGSLAPEKSAMSSSVGSVNMLASESESGDSDEDASMGGDDTEDPIFTTPQVHKLQNPNAPTPFHGPPLTPGGGSTAIWANGNLFSPAQASLMKTIRKTRLHKNGRRNRKSSSSASGSGYSSMNSPRTTSPPPIRSIETTTNGGYFRAARSRRESLALGTDGLHLSSGNDSGDEASANTTPSTPGVIRRPVAARRQNLLPKTKGFARIRAALMEEAAPIDTEVRREAETIRQVRERDGSLSELDLTERPQPATAPSSPNFLPAVPESSAQEEDFISDDQPKGLGMNFATHASRNSGGMEYWNRFDPSMRTPPPPPNFARQSSSVMSDINMDSETNGGTPSTSTWRRPRARSSASDASQAFVPTTSSQAAGVSDDMHLKKFKRRREDDFDIATIKRRAVSPGMSAQNSPVLTQSPSQREATGAGWGQPPERKDTSKSQPQSASSETSGQQTSGSRHGSGGSVSSVGLGPGGKKVGAQGMVDTNDGLMKMSIE